MCVLLVDDHGPLRAALAELIAFEGYTVWQAANGDEALQLLRRMDPPCVLLTDLDMPVMNGHELAAQVRGNPAWSQIRIVFFSGSPELAPQDEPVLSKWCTTADLLHTLGRAHACRQAP
jgi:CheY-like chemotaxis protein